MQFKVVILFSNNKKPRNFSLFFAQYYRDLNWATARGPYYMTIHLLRSSSMFSFYKLQIDDGWLYFYISDDSWKSTFFIKSCFLLSTTLP